MLRSIEMCRAVALCVAVTACGKLPLSKEETGKAAESEPEVSELAKAQDGAAEDSQRDLESLPSESAGRRGGKRESLTCYTGNDNHHARIGVELEGNQVAYFAYYSKARPRTCSIEARRGDPYSRWTDNGKFSTVTLVDQKGRLRIEHKDGAYHFAFLDVDRVRFCGMQGKINGTLTVVRGKESCVVQGIMDGHSM